MNDWVTRQVEKHERDFINKGIDKVTGLGGDSKSSGPSGAHPVSAPPGPVFGPPSSAYSWTRITCQGMPALTPAQLPDRSGLSGWLDDRVKSALDACGIMDYLEKVAGNLPELNEAADEWHAQAVAVKNMAEQLRAECQSLPDQWQGAASDAFGRHMGDVVGALDSTAAELYQTAQIINQAAQMCAMAESMVIQIISEAIEALIASLAMEAVVTVLTLGIGAIASAMVDAAEVTAFIARVAKVSEELAANLRKLVDALKEMRTGFKAVKDLKTAREALKSVQKVRTAVKDIREMKDGGDSLIKIGKDAKEAKSLEGVGGKLGEYAVRQGANYVDSKATDWAQGEFKEHVLGDSKDDSVSAFNPHDLTNPNKASTGTGKVWTALKDVGVVGGAMGKSAWGAAKPDVLGDQATAAYEGQAGQFLQHNQDGQEFAGSEVGKTVLSDTGIGGDIKEKEADPTPYRVDKSRIEQAFG